MKVYVIRHGSTDWNAEKRLQGNSNTKLNEKGREQARKTSEAFKDIDFKYIFSSPLDRAYETACILKRDRNIEVIKDDRLIEMGFGVDEGVTFEKRTPGCNVFFEAPGEYVPHETAESIESLFERTADFIYNVLVPLSEKEPDAKVLISGHGAMNKGLMGVFLKRDKARFWDGAWQRNCSITTYEVNGKDFRMLEDGLNYCGLD